MSNAKNTPEVGNNKGESNNIKKADKPTYLVTVQWCIPSFGGIPLPVGFKWTRNFTFTTQFASFPTTAELKRIAKAKNKNVLAEGFKVLSISEVPTTWS